MKKQYIIKALVIVTATVLSVSMYATIASANHSLYVHWARKANPFKLKIGDNVGVEWDAYLATASADWSKSSVLDTIVVLGQSNTDCRPTDWRIEVCNKAYGANGWLGLAMILSQNRHIDRGTVMLNDTYFNTATYNTPAMRRLVMCQEIGHTLGLDHQDTNFYNKNLGTCMDYTTLPGGIYYVPDGAFHKDAQLSNEHPNAHDYGELETIYKHLDSITTALNLNGTSSGTASVHIPDINIENQSEWGKVIQKSNDGRSSIYERDLGNGGTIFTFIIWAN